MKHHLTAVVCVVLCFFCLPRGCPLESTENPVSLHRAKLTRSLCNSTWCQWQAGSSLWCGGQQWLWKDDAHGQVGDHRKGFQDSNFGLSEVRLRPWVKTYKRALPICGFGVVFSEKTSPGSPAKIWWAFRRRGPGQFCRGLWRLERDVIRFRV